MVKDHSDSDKGNLLLTHGLLFLTSSKDSFICIIPEQDNTYHSLYYTSHGAMAQMRNSSMGPPWRIDLFTHRTMIEHSYHGATSAPGILESVYQKQGDFGYWVVVWVVSCNIYSIMRHMEKHPNYLPAISTHFIMKSFHFYQNICWPVASAPGKLHKFHEQHYTQTILQFSVPIHVH